MEPIPVPVLITIRFNNPPLDYGQDGWAIAWTRNAVLCFWQDHEGNGRSGWMPPADIRRRHPRQDPRPKRG